MKPSEVTLALEWCIGAGKPVHIIGQPGVGKTSIVKQVADKLGYQLKTTRLSLSDPVDLRGLPDIDRKGGVTHWLPPGDFPQGEDGPPIVWFFDEWQQGVPAVQSSAGQLLNERALGDYKLPDRVYVCAASNRARDRAATNTMPAHIRTRFFWLEMEIDQNDWVRWALKAGLELETIAFIKWQPKALSAFDPAVDVSATPRSWEDVSAATAAAKKSGLLIPPNVELATYAGKVGLAWATDYVGFLRQFRNMPDPDGFLLNPDKATIPTEPGVLIALAAVIARRASVGNFDRVIKLANRLPKEYAVTLVSQATDRDEKLKSTRPFVEWAADNGDLLS